MKKFIIEKCMNYIEKNTNYDHIKLKEIEYGLVGIYLTITKMIIIFSIAFILNIFKEMLIFTLIFNIVRMPAFGLHATKSWICLLSSLLIFIILPYSCTIFNINVYIKMFICMLCIFLMFKNAPADTQKRPIVSAKRRKTYKALATLIAILFSIGAIFIKNNFLSNCLIFALVLENLLISPFTYRLFKLPYNNYITYLNKHPDLSK